MPEKSVWLITGASRGIGRAVAERVLAAGDRVTILARGETVLSVAEELGSDCLGLQCDVADRRSVTSAMESALQHWGRLDFLVNNAGLHRGGKVQRLDPKDWQAVLDTNLTGAMNLVAAATDHLEAGAGIVNVGAVVGFRGFPGDSAYAASKAGLAGLTRALSIELAKRDVRVNLVIPGLVLTEMTGALSEKALESMRQTIPLGRYGSADEIAEVVEWVARSRYMTGAFVPADGGLMSSFGTPG